VRGSAHAGRTSSDRARAFLATFSARPTQPYLLYETHHGDHGQRRQERFTSSVMGKIPAAERPDSSTRTGAANPRRIVSQSAADRLGLPYGRRPTSGRQPGQRDHPAAFRCGGPTLTIRTFSRYPYTLAASRFLRCLDAAGAHVPPKRTLGGCVAARSHPISDGTGSGKTTLL